MTKAGIRFGLALVCLSALPAMAQNQQIPQNKTITEIHAFSAGASIRYTPASTGTYGCGGESANDSVHIDWSTDERYQAVYSAALAAYAGGKTVGFGVNGCVVGFGGELPKVYRLDVKN